METQFLKKVIHSKTSVSATKQLKVQHELAIEILQKYGRDRCRLEPRGKDQFRCLAWSVSLVEGNGSSKLTKCGEVRVK
jgi:hypothetical protein